LSTAAAISLPVTTVRAIATRAVADIALSGAGKGRPGVRGPLLTLGIPGSATTAVLIWEMMIHKLTPGPQFFYSRPKIIYGLFAAMLAANAVLLVVGLLGSRLWVKVTAIPRVPLCAVITLMSVLGCYASRNAMFDVFAGLAFGIVG